MTDKITLTNLANLQNETTAVNAINSNNASIITAINNTLSRDGTSPNTMSTNLDMNNNQILNLPSPASAGSPVRLQDVVSGATIASVPPVGTSGATVGLLNANNTYTGLQTFNHTVTANSPNVLIVGSTPTDTVNDGASAGFGLTVAGTTSDSEIVAARYLNATNPPRLAFIKSRGATIGAHTVLQAGDSMGSIDFHGDTGTVTAGTSAQIQAIVDNSAFGAALPCDLTFSTAPANSATPTERMRVTANGGLAVGSTNDPGTGSIGATGVIHAGWASPVTAGGDPSNSQVLLTNTNVGIFVGSGPPTISAAQGSLYLNTTGNSTSTRAYINSNGSTGWVAITTAS